MKLPWGGNEGKGTHRGAPRTRTCPQLQPLLGNVKAQQGKWAGTAGRGSQALPRASLPHHHMPSLPAYQSAQPSPAPRPVFILISSLNDTSMFATHAYFTS